MHRMLIAIVLVLFTFPLLASDEPAQDWPQNGQNAYLSFGLGTLVPGDWRHRLRRKEKEQLTCKTTAYCEYRPPFCTRLTIRDLKPIGSGSAWEGDVRLCLFEDRDHYGDGICFRLRGEWELAAYATQQKCRDFFAGIVGQAFADAFSGKDTPLPFTIGFDDYGVWTVTRNGAEDE